MRKKFIFAAGIILILCLLFACSSQGAGTEDEYTAAAEEGPPGKEKVPGETKTEKEKEGESEGKEEGEVSQVVEYLGYDTVSEKEIVFEFSQPVTVIDLHFDPDFMYEYEEEGSLITVNLLEEVQSGQKITANFQVEDELGNIVEREVTFRSKNNRVPKLQINELRTEYSNPKGEFIEFKMLSEGNLGSLRVFAEGNNKVPLIYTFDPVEVKANDYVVLHLRTWDASFIDEYGGSKDESNGTESSSTAWDFWISGSSELLRKTDAVYVLDQDGNVLDAVMIAENPDPQWGKDYFVKAAEFLYNQGAWKSPAGTICTPANAVKAKNSTLTQTICRDETAENTHTAADWYTAATSNATPGKPNSNKRL